MKDGTIIPTCTQPDKAMSETLAAGNASGYHSVIWSHHVFGSMPPSVASCYACRYVFTRSGKSQQRLALSSLQNIF